MNIFLANRRDLPENYRMEGLAHELRRIRQAEIDTLHAEVSVLRKLNGCRPRREVRKTFPPP